jgi:hypothetical protein
VEDKVAVAVDVQCGDAQHTSHAKHVPLEDHVQYIWSSCMLAETDAGVLEPGRTGEVRVWFAQQVLRGVLVVLAWLYPGPVKKV